jgi:hypothetical protein
MKWISVDDGLPEDGQAVLVRYNRDNWLRTHTLADGSTRLNWRWQAAIFVRGRTADECAAMNLYRGQDQWGNNRVPYQWEQFGPGDLFGQDVSHWAAITDPLQPNTRIEPDRSS